MKAWAVQEFGPPENLRILDFPKPKPQPRDLIVKVLAVAVNPADCKLRSGYIWGKFGTIHKPPAIQGYDCSGVVEKVGDEVQNFSPGDAVYFSGDVKRQGCFAEYVAVDERIVGRKPSNLSHEEAAALPLSSLTAWEGLVDGMNLAPLTAQSRPSELPILIIGGAGGVGSITIQLAKKVFGLTVIATASRPESEEWCKKMGADYVINHSKNLKEQLNAIGYDTVPYLFLAANAKPHWESAIDCLSLLGKLVVIIGIQGLDPTELWFKRITLFPELMFSRPFYMTDDSKDETHREILNGIASLVEQGALVTTKTVSFPWQELPEAEKRQESACCIGKQTSTIKF